MYIMRKKQICYNGRKYGEKEQKVHADIRRGIDETTKNAKIIKESHMEKERCIKKELTKKEIFTPIRPGRMEYIPHRRLRSNIEAKDMIFWL